MTPVGHIIQERLAAGTISGQDTYTVVISGGNAITYIPKRVLIAGKNNDTGEIKKILLDSNCKLFY